MEQAADLTRDATSALRRRAAVIGLICGYAVIAAFYRPLTVPALVAVLLVGTPLVLVGVARRPRGSRPVGGGSAAVWLGLGGAAGFYELALWLGPNDRAHPTLSTLTDPVLATYPGRVAGYVLWIGLGVWLASR